MKLKFPHLLKPLGTIIQQKYWSFYPSEPFSLDQFNVIHPVAFWNFKLNVLKYLRNCKLHNTLIPWILKNPVSPNEHVPSSQKNSSLAQKLKTSIVFSHLLFYYFLRYLCTNGCFSCSLSKFPKTFLKLQRKVPINFSVA